MAACAHVRALPSALCHAAPRALPLTVDVGRTLSGPASAVRGRAVTSLEPETEGALGGPEPRFGKSSAPLQGTSHSAIVIAWLS